MARALPVLVAACLCMGFDWPGRLRRLEYELGHGDVTRRREVTRQLASYPGPAVEKALLGALEDDDTGVREDAAQSAGRVRLRAAVPILRDWLDDREPRVRAAAATALAEIGDTRVREPLVRALGDTSGEVRRAAVDALARLGGEEVVPPLLARLEDPDAPVRIAAAVALGELGDGRAVVPLVGAARDESPEVRASVLASLGRLGDMRARPALEQALADREETVRLAAVAGLGRVGGEAVTRALARTVRAPDARLATAAIAALGMVDDPGALRALLGALDQEQLRESATDALVVAARREAAARKAPSAVVEELVTALEASASALRTDAIATTLSRLAPIVSIAGAAPALAAKLEAGRAGDAVVRALGATGASDALVMLLERLEAGEVHDREVTLDALELHLGRAPADGRAADPLLAALAAREPVEPARLVRLIGRVGAVRALPALRPWLEVADVELRLATIEALARLGDRESADRIAELLGAPDVRTRFAAAAALHDTADVATVRMLLARLDAREETDLHAVVYALGGALAGLDAAELAKASGLEAEVLRALGAVLRDTDRALSDRALDALVVWHPPAAMDLVAARLRDPSSRKRAAAASALAAFPSPQTRAVLRYLVKHDAPRVAGAAAAALGELGEGRDVEALVRAAERRHWPLPAAAARGIARMAQRGEVKEHATRRLLCELGRSREPYVRANVAAALAVWGAAPCDAGPDPRAWLEHGRAAVVRIAAARWLAAAAAAGSVDAALATRALGHCAESDPDPAVRVACGSSAPQTESQDVEVQAYGPDGTTPLPERLVAVRFADGSVFVGTADANAHLRLLAATPGDVVLEDPGLVPLEPE